MNATREFAKDLRLTELFRFVKFGLTGVLNTAVDFLVFGVLSYLGINQYLAQIISYSTGMLNSYVINRSWTFQSKGRFWSEQMLRFILANFLLLAVSLGVLWLVNSQLGFSKLIAKLCATAVTMVVGFFINRFWVFREQQAD